MTFATPSGVASSLSGGPRVGRVRGHVLPIWHARVHAIVVTNTI